MNQFGGWETTPMEKERIRRRRKMLAVCWLSSSMIDIYPICDAFVCLNKTINMSNMIMLELTGRQTHRRRIECNLCRPRIVINRTELPIHWIAMYSLLFCVFGFLSHFLLFSLFIVYAIFCLGIVNWEKNSESKFEGIIHYAMWCNIETQEK